MDIVYPASYRRELFSRLAKLILRGESILLFGPSGIGKTSDMQYLLQSEKGQKIYFNDSKIGLAWLNADEDSEGDLTSFKNQLESLRLSDFNHIFVVVDHADRFLNIKNDSIFSAIRSLRESTRPKTAVITLANQNLTKINLNALAPIQYLIFENPICVPPLNSQDKKASLETWSNCYQTEVKESGREKIISASGGIPRLIKRLVKLYDDKIDLDNIIENPAQDPKIKLDLENIAAFNRANPECAYKVPLLEELEKESETNSDQVGPIRFDTRLSRQEYDLGKYLIDKKEEFVSREEMVEAIWKNKMYDVNEHALDQMLHRLRKKLQSATPKCKLITYRGRGCKLEVLN